MLKINYIKDSSEPILQYFSKYSYFALLSSLYLMSNLISKTHISNLPYRNKRSENKVSPKNFQIIFGR